MARLLLCVLALCVTGALARSNAVPKEKDEITVAKFFKLFEFAREPIISEDIKTDANDFGSIDQHLDKYDNVTAAKTYALMLKENWYLPRGYPFSVEEPAHAFEAMTLFNVLFSAKEFETFYRTAAYLKDIINEELFIYTVSAAAIHSPAAASLSLDAAFDIFPYYFNNAEILNIAQRINVHGKKFVENYPETFLYENKIIIKANSTFWPFVNDKNFALSYFTNDIGLNNAFYTRSMILPYWLSGANFEEFVMKERGNTFWFSFRQILARYYMERLSNGLGEIPEITDVVEDGFYSGLVFGNGVPFPSRPDNYQLDQPHLTSTLEKVLEFERRIWDAIDKGFYVDRKGEHVSLLTDDGLSVLGNLIESNADSPNRYYYKDFIRLWKQILGNNVKSNYQYESHFTPLVVPSALQKYETALRDPAFYMLYKRVMNFFVYWQKQMPLYKPEHINNPAIKVEKIETDDLVTFFDPILVNVTRALYRNDNGVPEVLVEHERLTHKPFSIKIKCNSSEDENVVVKIFLAPKYDSKGMEIPLHQNTENFYLLESFPYRLPAGESEIVRNYKDETYESVGSYKLYRYVTSYPDNLLLPKGKVGGQTFQLVVYVNENSFISKYNMAFPADRPMYSFQIKDVQNLKFQDVQIFHEE